MSGYILDLRKAIGHRTLIQCAASIIVMDEMDRILLGRRTDDRMWCYSGGSVEIDEKVEDCAMRELTEEMGIVADEISFFMVNSGIETHHVYPNGDEVSNIEIVFLCRKWHGVLHAQCEEMEELRFFSADEINLNLVMPPVRPAVKRLIAELRKDKT